MTGKRLLLIAIVINLFIMVAYLGMNPGVIAADSETEAPPVVENTQPQPAAEDQWKMIRQREDALKVRELELVEMEARIDKKIARLETLELSIKNEVQAYKQVSDERIRHLVKIYSSMKPKAAANLMNNLDMNVAVEVCLNMKGEIAGGILSYMDTKKAATITKKLAEYRSLSQPAAK